MEAVERNNDIKDGKYDAFRREDVAVMGSLYELCKTVLLVPLLPFRFFWMLLLVAIYSAMCAVATWGLPDTPHGLSMLHRSSWRTWVMAPGLFMCRLCLLGGLGMWVTVTPDSDWKVTNAQGEKAQVKIVVWGMFEPSLRRLNAWPPDELDMGEQSRFICGCHGILGQRSTCFRLCGQKVNLEHSSHW